MSQEGPYTLITVADGSYPTEGDLRKLLDLANPEAPECAEAFLELNHAFTEDSALLNHYGVFHIILSNGILLKVVDAINSDADKTVKEAATELLASVAAEGFKPSKDGDSSAMSVADLLMLAAISPNTDIADNAAEAVVKYVSAGEYQMGTLATTLVILAAPAILTLPTPAEEEEELPLLRKKIHLLHCLSLLTRAHVEFHTSGQCVAAAEELLKKEEHAHNDTRSQEENNTWEDLFTACYEYLTRARRLGYCSIAGLDDEMEEALDKINRLTLENEALRKENEEMKEELERLRALCAQQEVFGAITNLADVNYEFLEGTRLVREDNRVKNTGDEYQSESFLVGDRMTNGIHRITFKVPDNPFIQLGLCNADQGLPRRGYKFSQSGKGVEVTLKYGEIRNINKSTIGYINTVQKDDIVSLEVDLTKEDPQKRTLRFFVNGRPQKVVITGLPQAVKFGATLDGSRFIDFVSLEELSIPTAPINEGERPICWEHGEKEVVGEKEVPVKESITDLSNLEFHFSDAEKVKVQENYIVRAGEKSYETCFITKELANGVFRLKFKISTLVEFLYSGVIDSSLGYPKSSEDITFPHKGVEFRLSGGTLWEQRNRCVGSERAAKEGDTVSLVLDLRSPVKEERTLHWFINDQMYKYFFFALPPSVQVGFCMFAPGRAIEFLSLDELEDSPIMPKADAVPHPFEGDLIV